MGWVDKGGCETDLLFTIERIRKIVRDIKVYCVDSPHILADEFRDYISNEKAEIDDFVHFLVPISDKLNQKLDDLFEEDDSDPSRNWLDFVFERTDENARYWRLNREGRPLCGKKYTEVICGDKSYESCTCPSEFIQICNDLTEILKKYKLH